MSGKFFVIFCFILFGFVSAKKLPPYISYCHQSDPNLNQCVTNAVAQVKSHLEAGIPEFQLPPMNPLVLPEASLDNGDSFRALFRNIEVFYGHEFTLKSVNVDLRNNRVDMVLGFPRLRIKSVYQITGKLMILQLNGNGPADGNFTNVEARITMTGSRYIKGGKEYVNFDKNTLNLKLGRPIMKFDNLFPNNEELTVQTNRIINENIESIIEELKPVLTQVIGDFVFGLIGRIFSRFPIDELFPK